jgi:hypothetical protein
MPNPRNSPSEFFDDHGLDPVETATGHGAGTEKGACGESPAAVVKKKAGFYLTEDLLERFNRKYYELKLAGVKIDNKSFLVELVLRYGLDDLDKGGESLLMKKLDG